MNYEELPSRKRFPATDDIGFGVSPFDHLTRDELLRVAHLQYCALVDASSALREAEHYSHPGVWQKGSICDRAKRNVASVLDDYIGDRSTYHRHYYRYVSEVFFGADLAPWYTDGAGDFVKPLVGDAPEGMRLLRFEDVQPPK